MDPFLRWLLQQAMASQVAAPGAAPRLDPDTAFRLLQQFPSAWANETLPVQLRMPNTNSWWAYVAGRDIGQSRPYAPMMIPAGVPTIPQYVPTAPAGPYGPYQTDPKIAPLWLYPSI